MKHYRFWVTAWGCLNLVFGVVNVCLVNGGPSPRLSALAAICGSWTAGWLFGAAFEYKSKEK